MHTCEDMILYCLWKGLVRNCRRIFEVRYTDDGLCCSFNTIPLEDYLYDKLMAFQNIISIIFFSITAKLTQNSMLELKSSMILTHAKHG